MSDDKVRAALAEWFHREQGEPHAECGYWADRFLASDVLATIEADAARRPPTPRRRPPTPRGKARPSRLRYGARRKMPGLLRRGATQLPPSLAAQERPGSSGVVPMTADLHARIKTAVGYARATSARTPGSFMARICDHADDVLARHRHLPGSPWCEAHNPSSVVHPCPDVRALATAWLGEGWDQ